MKQESEEEHRTMAKSSRILGIKVQMEKSTIEEQEGTMVQYS